ncbi:uncharacterized protein CANTADRAFT_25175 [Suhomyces tanzawaensis NRRL Y-17324]|uniref:Uncharacterized protein n=1 Tax=Suhomyces tanzawaensis NRRL Y-17324 TaxID=984487 RepID=A0A1E4SML7_9ASCO|nr:uncharacterized protein CANTADRAFT_25175 [Suhomyces tanzawaensis NRRL Y-17324]ODV80761.1 hypothetical protein CANTADRAFT_25175 [Suhomyces tanzawaensis NRRL Y-17324]
MLSRHYNFCQYQSLSVRNQLTNTIRVFLPQLLFYTVPRLASPVDLIGEGVQEIN